MSDPRFSFASDVSPAEESTIRDRLGGTIVRVVSAPDALSTYLGQVLLLQVTTLLTRLFDRVELAGDDNVQVDPQLFLLSGSVLAAIRNLLPALRPLAPQGLNGQQITVVIGVGAAEMGDLYVGATGWSALLSTRTPQPVANVVNPIGALAAGALGAAEVFKKAFLGQIPTAFTVPDYALSLLTYGLPDVSPEPLLPDNIYIDAVQFGAGSIGCGFLLGMLLAPHFRGRFVVVDNGHFDTKNPYKYQLLDWATAERGLAKAVWTQQQLVARGRGRLDVRAFVGTARSYVATLPADYRLPVAVAAVDTVEARLEIQDTLPERIVNAGIDGTLVEVSVHGFGEGPCLACLAMQRELESWNSKPIADRLGLDVERVHRLIRGNEGLTLEDLLTIKRRGVAPQEYLTKLDEFLGQPVLSLYQRVMYSEAAVTTARGTAARITTAFCSAFAGALLFSEFVKQSVPEFRSHLVSNSYRQELLGVPGEGPFRHSRDEKGWCLCYSSFRLALYREKYGAR